MDEDGVEVVARRTEALPVSTKITVAHAHEPLDFHLYQECGDKDNLHLEVVLTDSLIKLSFPIGIAFGVARKISMLEASAKRCAEQTDAEIAETVAAEVDARIENAHDPLTQLMGILTYGSVHDPREDQISNGLEELTRERNRCVETLQLAEDVEMGRL